MVYLLTLAADPVTKVSFKFKLFAQASGQRRPQLNVHEFSFFHRELESAHTSSIRDVVLSMGAIYFDTSYIPVDSCCAKQAICVSGLSRMFEVQPNIFLFVHTRCYLFIAASCSTVSDCVCV